jgi:predicted protein tyrosine phosphatase
MTITPDQISAVLVVAAVAISRWIGSRESKKAMEVITKIEVNSNSRLTAALDEVKKLTGEMATYRAEIKALTEKFTGRTSTEDRRHQ